MVKITFSILRELVMVTKTVTRGGTVRAMLLGGVISLVGLGQPVGAQPRVDFLEPDPEEVIAAMENIDEEGNLITPTPTPTPTPELTPEQKEEQKKREAFLKRPKKGVIASFQSQGMSVAAVDGLAQASAPDTELPPVIGAVQRTQRGLLASVSNTSEYPVSGSAKVVAFTKSGSVAKTDYLSFALAPGASTSRTFAASNTIGGARMELVSWKIAKGNVKAAPKDRSKRKAAESKDQK